MPDPVTSPGKINIGGVKVSKSVAFIGGGALLIGGVLYYRHKQSTDAANAAIATAGATTTDPATGYPYGSAEDQAALAAQAGYDTGSSADAGYGYTTYGGGYGTSTFGAGTPGSFVNNAEWAQFVVAYMVNNEGADAPTINNAIGEYLAGQPLTSDIIGLVESCIAIGGYPPVSGPNGDPPNYITSSTTPTSTGTTVLVPDCSGGTTGNAHNLLVAAGLVPTDTASSNKGEASWQCTGTNPSAGTTVAKGSEVAILSQAPATTPATTPKPTATKTYTVVSGDNLSEIAAKYGMTWQTLYAANKSVVGSNPNLIRPGEVLTIP